MKGLQFGIKEQNIALKVSQKHDPDKNLGGLAGLCPGDKVRPNTGELADASSQRGLPDELVERYSLLTAQYDIN